MSFYLYLPKDTTFKIDAVGTNKANISYNKIINSNTENFELDKDYKLKRGTYKFKGNISFFDSTFQAYAFSDGIT